MIKALTRKRLSALDSIVLAAYALVAYTAILLVTL